MLEVIEQLYQTCISNKLNIAPEKSFYILLTVKFLGHENGNSTVKLISSKNDGIHKLKAATPRAELM